MRLLPLLMAVSLTACIPTRSPESIPPEYIGPYPETVARISERARELVARQGTTGVSIALVDSGQVIWSAGFGYADRVAGVPATADTVYRAGSVAKPLTALAVMQSAERGLIDPDRPVHTYISDFSVRSRFRGYREITARDLMRHTAGLPCDIAKGMWSAEPLQRVTERLADEFATAPPARVTNYSNIGYSLLGLALENVTGRDFSDHLESEVLRPLGMHHSTFRLNEATAPLLARGHRDGRERPLLPIRDIPAAALYTTAADLGRFIGWLLSPERAPALVSSGTLDAMFTAQNGDVALDFDRAMGLGWSLDAGRLAYAGRVARHGGQTPLFSAEVILLRDQGLGVAVLANEGNARDAVRSLAELTLYLALREKRGLTPGAPETAPAAPADVPLPANAAGRFMTELGLLEIDAGRGTLTVRRLDQELPLLGYSGTQFGVDARAARATGDKRLEALGAIRLSVESVDGRDVLVAHHRGQRKLFGTDVGHPAESADWRPHVGRFRVTNPDPGFPLADLAVQYHEGNLFLEYRMPFVSEQLVRLALMPLSDREALTLGMGRGGGETVRVTRTASGETLLRYSGYRAVRVN